MTRRYDLSLDPARGRRRRGFAAGVGLWIVLFNVLAAIGLGAVAKADDPASEKIIVCTGLGAVTLDRDGKPVDPGAPQAPCPFCLPMMQGQLDVPVAIAAPAAPIAGADIVASLAESVPPALARAVRAASARAPPFA